MKLGELLRFINEELGLESNEIEALAGSGDIQSIELDDSIKEQLQGKLKSFLTVEAAKNNSDLDKYFKNKHYPSIKGEVLGNTDTKLTAFAKEFLNEEEVSAIEEAEWTGDKLKIFEEGFKRYVADKTNDEEHKKLVESMKKQIAKAEKEKTEAVKAKEQELADKTKEFNDRLIKKEFNRFIDENYELADAYKKPVVKQGIYDAAFKEAVKKAKLMPDEDGNISLRNIENPEMAYYIDGSKEGTLNNLVDPAIKDFLKKSDKADEKKPVYQPSNPVNVDNLNPMYADRLRRAQEADNGAY